MNEDLPEGGHKSDADWLRDAFDRALRGDNGTTSEAMTPAVSPFESANSEAQADVSAAPFDPNATVPIEEWELPQAPTVLSADQGAPDFVGGPEIDGEADDTALIEAVVEPAAEPVVETGVFAEPAPSNDPFASAIYDALQEYDEPVVSDDDVDNEPDAFDFLFGGSATTVDAPAGTEQPATQLFAATVTPASTAPVGAQHDVDAPGHGDATIALPVAGLTLAPAQAPRAPRSSDPQRTRAMLIAISAGLGVALLSVGAYFGGALIAAPAPSATPTETALPDTARPAGEWAWDELVGGECISGTTSPWEATYTVVDCATPHESQLVFRGDLVTDAQVVSYPGDDAIGGVVGPLCATQGMVDLLAAGEYTDIVMSASYASSAADWDAGNTEFFCFVSRTGGTVSGSLAGTALTEGLILPEVDATDTAETDTTNP